MKKSFFLLLLFASVFISCGSSHNVVSDNPFDPSTGNSDSIVRNKIVVISDLHLGNDLSYSEDVKHLSRLKQFLNEVRSSATIKELVIAGDMFDEWYIPTRTNTYDNKSQADFVKKTVVANQSIFNVINGIIGDKKIKVTYIPGNHDMGFTPENVDIAMPGVNQARDSKDKYGIGTYNPDGYPQIAIEHGHRYDFFCSLTPNANDAEAPGAVLAPGYFFARIAANSFTDPTTHDDATKVPVTVLNNQNDPEQYSKYIYYGLWKKVLEDVIYVKDDFDAKIITTNVGHYTKTYSINDVLPHNSTTDGSIQMNLYNGLFTQNNWDNREQYNNAPIMTNINDAIKGSLATSFIDDQSDNQYFRNSQSGVRLVIFGHTHIPMIKTYKNLKGSTCVYANSGTWEDYKSRDKSKVIEQDSMNMTFVVVSPMKTNKKKLQVGLYQYRFGKHFLTDSKSLDISE